MPNFIRVFLFLLIALPCLAQPIVYVTQDGAGNASGTSWTNALSGTLLAGKVATASSGTQFWIAAGTYKPTTTTDRAASFSIASGVSVYGGFLGTERTLAERIIGSNETIFSGEIGIQNSNVDNSFHVITINNADISTRLDRITVSDGTANYSGGRNSVYMVGENVHSDDLDIAGGGVLNINTNSSACNTPLLTECKFKNNKASFGAAFYSSAPSCSSTASFTLSNCVFENNEGLSFGSGGALFVSSGDNIPYILNCTFSNNRAFFGGGTFIYNCSPKILNCVFQRNHAGFNGGGSGGGLFVSALNGTSNPTLFNCLFTDNDATVGGAIFNANFENGNSEMSIINCSITANNASYKGGSIAIQDTIYSDRYNISDFKQSPHPIIKNSILWDNSLYKQSSISIGYRSFAFYTFNITEGNFLQSDYLNFPSIYKGIGNNNIDPKFANSTANNFRLQPNSPAINAGDPNTVGLPAFDLAGQVRTQNGRVDMGAYEFGCIPATCQPISAQRIR